MEKTPKEKHICNESCGGEQVTTEQRELLHKCLDEIADDSGIIILLQAEKIDEKTAEMSAKIIVRHLSPMSAIDGLIESKILTAKEILKFLLLKEPKIMETLTSIGLLASKLAKSGIFSSEKKKGMHEVKVCPNPNCKECKKK